jgi:hypothetical protein
MSKIQFTGDNHKECHEFIDGAYDPKLNYPNVITRRGTEKVRKNDWIIKHKNGDLALHTRY